MNAVVDVTKDRNLGLGGSEALAYCGRDPRCTPLQLYLRKVGEAGERPPEDARQEWGHRLEPVVRAWLAEKLGREITVPDAMFRSAQHPFLLGHLDGLAGDEGVEIKTGDKFTSHEFGDVETDQVPIRYVLQCTHYMLVTEMKRFHLGALLGGNDARHYVIDFDAELGELLMARATAFWQQVQTRTPPDAVTLHDADKRWPKSYERGVIATAETILALEALRTERAAEKTAGKRADAHELMIKTFLGDADALTDAQGKRLASWRTQQRTSFDARKFGEDHPDLCAQYQRVSSFRVFRVR